MTFTSLDSPYTVLQSPDVFLILGDQIPESFALWSLLQFVSLIHEVHFPALQAPPEGVEEGIILELPSSVFNLLRPSFLCDYLNLSLFLGWILSPTPKMLPSSRLFLILRPTPVVTGGHLAAGVLVVGSPLSGFTDSL